MDSYSTNQDTPLIIIPLVVLSNDTDQDGDPLTAVPWRCIARLSFSQQHGGFTYTPTGGYYGPDSFTYKANDTHGDSNIATVNLTVYASGREAGRMSPIRAIADQSWFTISGPDRI